MAITTLEEYLRCYVNYQQDDWADYLPIAEFAANNQASETTGVSPFFANNGYDPRMDFEISPSTTEDPEAGNFGTRMQEIHEHLRQEIAYAQDRQQEYAD